MFNISRAIGIIKNQFDNEEYVSIGETGFLWNEKKYVIDTIDLKFLSLIDAYVDKFEAIIPSVSGTIMVPQDYQ